MHEEQQLGFSVGPGSLMGRGQPGPPDLETTIERLDVGVTRAATASGRVRDTVYFSIVDSEWPAIKERLGRLLK